MARVTCTLNPCRFPQQQPSGVVLPRVSVARIHLQLWCCGVQVPTRRRVPQYRWLQCWSHRWPVQADNHVCNCKFPMGTGTISSGDWVFEACAFQFQVCALHVRSLFASWPSLPPQHEFLALNNLTLIKCSGFLDVLALIFPFKFFRSALGRWETKNLATSHRRRFRHRPFRCLQMWLQR